MGLITLLKQPAAAGGGGFDGGLLTNGDFATGDLTDWVVNPASTRWEYAYVDPYHCAHFTDTFNAWLEQLTFSWEDSTDYTLSYRIVETGPDILITVTDGASNSIGTLDRSHVMGVYTIDFTSGVGWTDGIRFYGNTAEQYCKMTEISLKKR